jgi:hypothetical protein
MKEDPAIEMVREVRCRISAHFGHDTRALVEHYRELEKGYADRMLRPEERRSCVPRR